MGRPKKQIPKESSGPKREMITLEMKKDIIEMRDRGMSVTNLCHIYRKSSSTICTILKQKDKILAVDPSKGVTRITKKRPPIIDNVEKLLLEWINEKWMEGDTINEPIIRDKARELYAELLEKMPRTSEEPPFKASKGWFDKFKNRAGIHSVFRHGEDRSSDVTPADEYFQRFKSLVDSTYLPRQVLYCDEKTGLFRKRTPRRTYITAEDVTIGLEVNGSDVEEHRQELLEVDGEELVGEHSQELTTEDLLQLHDQQRKENVGEISSGKEDEEQSSSDIKEMLKSWESVSAYVEKYLPDKAVAVQSTNLFNENVISHFRDILKRRQEQISMDKFVVRPKFEPEVSELEPSVEPDVVELATEPELEILSVKLSTKRKKKRIS